MAYRFTRVAFGLKCSPFLLAATVDLHLRDQAAQGNKVAQEIIKNIYVDNIILNIEKPEHIPMLHGKIKNIFYNAEMNVREFTSNRIKEITALQKEDLDLDPTVKNKRKLKEIVKVLGMKWNIEEDTFIIKLPTFPLKAKRTKRTVLSQRR